MRCNSAVVLCTFYCFVQTGWQQGAFTQMQTQEVRERIPVQKMVTEYQEVRRQVQVPVQMVPQPVQVMIVLVF